MKHQNITSVTMQRIKQFYSTVTVNSKPFIAKRANSFDKSQCHFQHAPANTAVMPCQLFRRVCIKREFN